MKISKKETVSDKVKVCASVGLTIRMPTQYIDKLEESARNANIRKCSYVRKIVLDYLDKEYKNKEGANNTQTLP